MASENLPTRTELSHWCLEFALRWPDLRKRVSDLIDDCGTAYIWAKQFPEDSITVRDQIKDELIAYYWARDIGDREVMRPHIKSSSIALM